MTPVSFISLAGLLITGAAILIQLGRVLARLDTVADGQKEIKDEQKHHRDSLERVRGDVALGARDHAHLVDHVDTLCDRIARTESRLDTAPHGMPAQRPSR